MSRPRITFSDLRTAAYCPRKCYYRRTRNANREPPPEIEAIRDLATRYGRLLEASVAELEAEPIARPPANYRRTLAATRARLADAGDWERLCEPRQRDVLVSGRDCRGKVHKVLTEPLEPVLVSTGSPPERGIWESQSVHAVAAAKALAWEHRRPVERVWLEYPAYGVVRSMAVTTRRKARYRRALRTVRELDGPPPRTNNRAKCESCEFAAECGVRTRTLRSLLGFG